VPRRNRLTLCMVLWDEEATLERCLKSLRYVERVTGSGVQVTRPVYDEFIALVDNKTQDRTVEIAERYGATVHRHDWPTVEWHGNKIGDFSTARNRAESYATGDYVLWIDGDEVIEEGLLVIRGVVDAGEIDWLNPIFRSPSTPGLDPGFRPEFTRQALLHRRDLGQWQDALHEEYSAKDGGGILIATDRRVVYTSLDRPGGDRPNVASTFDALHVNLGKGWKQRHVCYLAREYFCGGYFHEAIALIEKHLAGPRDDNGLERSYMAIMAGSAYDQLEDYVRAGDLFLRAVAEWPVWADPYYAYGDMLMRRKNWLLATAMLSASVAFQFPDEAVFTDRRIYDRLRYDKLSMCFAMQGELESARHWVRVALKDKPKDERLLANLAAIEDGIRRSDRHVILVEGDPGEDRTNRPEDAGAAGDASAGRNGADDPAPVAAGRERREAAGGRVPR
jgi:glycosyltransferase involved in cell wall biosynthesis